MQYLAELRTNWRPLLGAAIGMGSGMGVVGVITSTIVPNLIADVGWSKASFAMIGSISMLTAFVFPIVGRLTDLIGVRWTAFIGQVTLPFMYVAYAMMNGEFWVYAAIFTLQATICVTTTSTVYTRLVVQYVERARGLALAIIASGPALVSIAMAPLLNHYVEVHGWRAAYYVVAAFSAVAGLATFLLIPSEKKVPRAQAAAPKRRARDDYPMIFRMRAFWYLFAAMALCNMSQTIQLVQLKMLMLDNGVTGEGAALMISTLWIGTLAGRFVAGVALDRMNAHIAAFFTLGLPSIGLYLIASSWDATAVLTFAVFCLGFAFGAEGDIIAFLVARHFPVAVYSSALGLLATVIAFSTAFGAALLSFTMARTGGYDLYLVIVGTGVLLGATILLMLGRLPESRSSQAEADAALRRAEVTAG